MARNSQLEDKQTTRLLLHENPAVPQNPTSPQRVLIVNENRDLANFLATHLAAAGFRVELVFDDEAALEAADVFRPHVCLVDVNTPRIGVYDLAYRLRELVDHPPLLANVTPFAERNDWDADVEFDIAFTKPSDPAVVVCQLQDFLNECEGRQARSVLHKNAHQLTPRLPEPREHQLLHASRSGLWR